MNIILQTGIAGMIRKAVNTMALKGSAKIELTNADGSKQVVEHGNMITDAVNDLLFTARGEMSNIMRISDYNTNYVDNMFGGILLFEDALNNDASDYYIPNLKITGYASQDAYNGLDIARGSFNQPESGLQEDGSYKLVWDFSTSQGNGVIKSLGLCPNLMGKIGASNSVVASERKGFMKDKGSVAPFNGNQYMLPTTGSTEGVSNYSLNIVAVIGSIAYAVSRDNLRCDESSGCISKNGGVLKIYRFNISTESVSISSVVGMASYIDCIDIQLPTDFVSVLSTTEGGLVADYFWNQEEKKLILYPCYKKSALNKNDTTKYVEIDFANNMNVTTYTFTNNAGSIYMGSNVSSVYDNGSHTTFFVFKDYVLTIATSDGKTRLYSTKRSDNTDVKVAKDASGNEFLFSGYKIRIRYVYAIGNLVVFGIPTDNNYDATSFDNSYIFDMSTGLIKETNANALTCRSNVPLSNKLTWAATGPYLALKIAVCPFILTTKNNLDAPVTKTASQTMKITYTLKESEV